MDNTSSLRVGAHELGVDLEWRIRFAETDLVAAKSDDIIWINVGRSEGDGIVNYRAEHSESKGSSATLVRQQSAVFAHLMQSCPRAAAPTDGKRIWRPTVVFDRSWKPDDAVAFFLLDHLIRNGELPKYSRELAEYMAQSRRGAPHAIYPRINKGDSHSVGQYRKLLDNPNEFPPISLYFAMLVALLDDEHEGPTKGENRVNRMTKLAEYALEKVSNHIASKSGQADLWREFDMTSAPNWHDDCMPNLRELTRIRLGEASNSIKNGKTLLGACISSRQEGGTSLVGSCLYIRGNKGDLRKALILPVINAGLIVVPDQDPSDQPRVVVLHDPDCGWYEITLSAQELGPTSQVRGSLKGLGHTLEEHEQRCRTQGGQLDSRRSAAQRFADIPGIDDPWYDGRDHDFALVGSPRWSKSELEWKLLQSVICDYYWRPRLSGWDLWSIAPEKQEPKSETQQSDDVYVYRRRQEHGDPTLWRYPASVPGPNSDNVGESRWMVHYLNQSCDPKEQKSFRAFEKKISGDNVAGFRVAVIRMEKRVFESTATRNLVDAALPKDAREELALKLCGANHREVPVSNEMLVNIGEDGLVIWTVVPSDYDTSSSHKRWQQLAMDILCRRDELRQLVASTQNLKVDDSVLKVLQFRGAASNYLERFVDILKSYQPEAATAAEQVVCIQLEEQFSIPTMVKRLEEFLQFSDERQRLQRDWLLNFALLLLAMLAVVQIPAGFIQAWSQWEAQKSRDTAFRGWADAVNPASEPWVTLWESSTLKAILIPIMFLAICIVFITSIYLLVRRVRRPHTRN